MGGVAGDEHAVDLVILGDRDAQIPEADIIEVAGKWETGDFLQQPVKVVIVARGIGRNRGVEEPALADVDAAELPIARRDRGCMHAIGGARRKPLELLMHARANENSANTISSIEVRATALDADLLAHGGVAAVATDRVIGLENLASGATVFSVFLNDGDAHAMRILFDRFRLPAEAGIDIGELCHPRAQHGFALVLRQSFVFLEVIGIDDFAQRRRVPIFAVEVAIGDDAAHRIGRRQQPRGAQRVGDAPKIKMLDRALRKILTLGDALRLEPAFDQSAVYAALPELDRERDADGSTADDDGLITLASLIADADGSPCARRGLRGCYCRTSTIGSGDSGTRCQVFASFSSNCQLCPRGASRTN